MIISGSGDNYVYRNLGLTYMSPDVESMNRIKKVAKAHKLTVNILDPNDPNSIGLNPFIFEDPVQTAIAIHQTSQILMISRKCLIGLKLLLIELKEPLID